MACYHTLDGEVLIQHLHEVVRSLCLQEVILQLQMDDIKVRLEGHNRVTLATSPTNAKSLDKVTVA